MAAALLLRSLARKMARAPPAHHHPLLARGLHGSGSLTQPPTMAAAAGLPSLATKVARAPPLHALRRLHALNSPNFSASTPPTSKPDVARTLANITLDAASFLFLGSLAYILLAPSERSVDAKLEEARTRKILDDEIEALKIRLAADVSTNGQIMQSSGHGEQPTGETGKGNKASKSG